jgi:phosphate acetyltransferase
MNILDQYVRQAKQAQGTVMFAEGDEERTLEAAVRLARDGVCRAVITGGAQADIERLARRKKIDLAGVEVVLPALERIDREVLQRFVRHMMQKGLSEQAARERALDSLSFAALFTASGGADALVAGARADTADVLRAAIYGIGLGNGSRLVSSFFLMVPPAGHPAVKAPLLFADCAVNPDPTAIGLTEIARATVRSFKMLFPGEEARVAFLSFSTKGSAEHPRLQPVRAAVAGTRKHFRGDAAVLVDGELQVDAALVPVVAARKAPESPVRGAANILIFPDLNAGNICYKMTERLGRFTAIGPILQGTRKPVSDLSRGCSVDDIYYAAVMTVLQGTKK